MSDTTPASPAPPAAKSGKSPLILILAVLIAVLAAGGGAFWYLRRGAPNAEASHPRATERGLLTFEPFVVNLADPNGSRFLRTTVQLVVGDAADAEHVQKTPVALMRARGAILELLTVQTADVLVTPDGKTALKKAIAEHASGVLDNVKVIDVLFSDFVVQF